MTTITLTRTKETICIDIKGHAEYAESGKDIVCSAISILAYTLAEHLATVFEQGIIKKKPIVELGDGSFRIECNTDDKKVYSYLLGKYMFVMVGYELIQNTYPEYVEIKINESLA